jgi:hypothetical protein
MTQMTTTLGAGSASASAETTTKVTRALLACGIVAGLLSVAVAVGRDPRAVRSWHAIVHSSAGVRLAVAAALTFAWLSAVAAWLMDRPTVAASANAVGTPGGEAS